MRNFAKKVWLGMLSGSLVTLGAGIIVTLALFISWLRHMFILDVQYYKAALVGAIPIILVAAGVALGVRALRNPED